MSKYRFANETAKRKAKMGDASKRREDFGGESARIRRQLDSYMLTDDGRTTGAAVALLFD